MIRVVGIKFKPKGKMYFFDPSGLKMNLNDKVIVETARGMEFGFVALEETLMHEEKIIKPLKNVCRIATAEDVKKNEDNNNKKAGAMLLCQEKINKHNLDMKLIDVEYTFDNNKIIFYFTSEGRVDFRELVKDLAGVFKMRIELRQIGVRDEAKMIGGIGNCGRELCCHQWLSEFQPVSIKMAKTQNLSLNPTKISGVCGRLMCCLKYENDVYEELKKGMPDVGEKIKTPEGMAIVMETVLLEQKIKAKMLKQEDNNVIINSYQKDEIKRIAKKKPKQNGKDDIPPEVKELLKD